MIGRTGRLDSWPNVEAGRSVMHCDRRDRTRGLHILAGHQSPGPACMRHDMAETVQTQIAIGKQSTLWLFSCLPSHTRARVSMQSTRPLLDTGMNVDTSVSALFVCAWVRTCESCSRVQRCALPLPLWCDRLVACISLALCLRLRSFRAHFRTGFSRALREPLPRAR